ncbi:DUF3237 domain-containing protein [Pararhodobacter sp.]|uniref:DUF3237 domain-containing protein n=1 Tax=Pararhodobacter sp. TaxID=2127056 RepID=UPI002AFFD184|nr:DUF3237 domain-containing protein [Pararhodobacter sp.]
MTMTDIDLNQCLIDLPGSPFAQQLAWEAVVTIAPGMDLGAGPLGHRGMVPITGGQFRGGPTYPDFHGTILAGGADRQLLRADGIKELRAIYEMRVADGTVLNIDNQVLVDANAQPHRYAVSRVLVTAPKGKWDWLNRRFFLGSLHSHQPNPGYVVIRGWEVLNHAG